MALIKNLLENLQQKEDRYDQPYCVYITIYSGSKMPSNYIGSSTVKALINGYRGSVRSKRYKDIWEQEIRNNPDLFNIQIISLHHTQREAIYKELTLQRMFNVVKSYDFINQSYAQPYGCYGMNMKGRPSPMKGRKHTPEAIRKGIESRQRNGTLICTDETKEKIRQKNKGVACPEERRKRISISLTGTKLSDERKKNIGDGQRKISQEIVDELFNKRENGVMAKEVFRWITEDLQIQISRAHLSAVYTYEKKKRKNNVLFGRIGYNTIINLT